MEVFHIPVQSLRDIPTNLVFIWTDLCIGLKTLNQKKIIFRVSTEYKEWAELLKGCDRHLTPETFPPNTPFFGIINFSNETHREQRIGAKYPS